eukprot:g2987.t1
MGAGASASLLASKYAADLAKPVDGRDLRGMSTDEVKGELIRLRQELALYNIGIVDITLADVCQGKSERDAVDACIGEVCHIRKMLHKETAVKSRERKRRLSQRGAALLRSGLQVVSDDDEDEDEDDNDGLSEDGLQFGEKV